MTISEQIDLLDRCLHNRSSQDACAFSLSTDGNSATAFSLIESLRIVDRERVSTDSSNRARSICDSIEQGLSQARLLTESQPCPILAIAGLLNAGKTSLVAGFLSSEGQSRLLIGSANQQGTHRFVLWLPEAWRNHRELWSKAMQQLETIFGHLPEELATDRNMAFRQYNGESFLSSSIAASDSIRIPLVATDAELDRWGIGLMDCPDVQTGITQQSKPRHSNDQTATEEIESIAASRARMLEQALKIASAFVVVTSANSIQDESVGVILNAASAAKPGLKRILAINRVPRRYSTSEIANEIGDGYRQFSIWRLYMAYHFDGPLDRHRLPLIPESMKANDSAIPSPIFFRIDTSPPVQPPNAVPAADLLVTLGSQLDRSQLVRELLHSTLVSLNDQCRQAWSTVDDYATESQRRLRRLHRAIAVAALSLSLNEGSPRSDHAESSLRLQVSREIVGQVASSLERTAPWWALPGRQLVRWSDQLRQIAGGVTKWVALPNWISDRASSVSNWVRSRWRSGEGGRIISATSYGEAIRAYDTHGDLMFGTDAVLSDEILQQVERIIERFQVESRTRLKEQQLDEFTRETWKRMSWRQRLWTGIAPAGLLFAPLLAVVMVPLDFGGTSVLVCASVKELLFAGMASVGMAMINNDQMPLIAEQEAAWQQLSDLFAISCDGFGIPRPVASECPELTLGTSKKRLLESSLPVRLYDQRSNRRTLLGVYRDFACRLDHVLQSLLSQSTNES